MQWVGRNLIAPLFNVLLLIVVGWHVLDTGFPSRGDGEFYFILLIIITPIVNLIALFWSDNDPSSWLALYFKRKALEEETKIQALKK